MKAIILGATRGMGRALARQLAEAGHELFLLGRDPLELERSAADLAARGGRAVATATLDLARPEGFAAALDVADGALGGFDTVVVTAADFATQEVLEGDRARLRRLLDTDFTATVVFCEEARERLLRRLEQGKGAATLCVFGSVAGDRARKPVGLYGAAKAGLAHYLESVDLRYGARGLRVLVVKPGFVRTGMTEGPPEPPFAADADAAVRTVARALSSGRRGVVYAPPIWRLIMLVVRSLPAAVRRRVNF